MKCAHFELIVPIYVSSGKWCSLTDREDRRILNLRVELILRYIFVIEHIGIDGKIYKKKNRLIFGTVIFC